MQTVEKTAKAYVTVAAPPAKAHTLRALFMSALAEGQSTLRSPLLAQDQLHAIDCLRGLGARIEIGEDVVVVDGMAGRPAPTQDELNVGESGVTMNFLTTVACLSPGPVTLTGAPGLLARPVRDLVDGLAQIGCRIDYTDREGCPPLRVSGGGLPGGTVRMSGAISSQYFSSLLTAGPCAGGPLTIECTDTMSEKPYIDITISMMQAFGAEVEREGYERFVVEPHGYAARDLTIEGDYSSASFFFQAAAVCGIEVKVTGLDADSVQGDRRFLELVERMGCGVAWEGGAVTVTGGGLRAIDVDMFDVPDLVPPLAVAAAFAEGESRLCNVAHLRHKESDRLAAIISELAGMGIEARVDGGDLVVVGGRPHGARIDPHNDHRIAMSFAVAGLAVGGQQIEDPGCVAKSFPDFWDRLAAFG